MRLRKKEGGMHTERERKREGGEKVWERSCSAVLCWEGEEEQGGEG